MPTPRRRSPAPVAKSSAARIIPEPLPRTQPAVYVRKVRGMGRGVFAARRFRPGDVIEICPVVPLPRSQSRKCEGEALDLYVFEWPRRGFPVAVVLGYGSLYNHSFEANASFTPRPAADAMVFRATRPIAAGEQIFIDYEWPAPDYHFPVGAKR